ATTKQSPENEGIASVVTTVTPSQRHACHHVAASEAKQSPKNEEIASVVTIITPSQRHNENGDLTC
ncbi:MAG: hypothetical protein WCC12_03355, partial [Anaerolineales bacterium]